MRSEGRSGSRDYERIMKSPKVLFLICLILSFLAALAGFRNLNMISWGIAPGIYAAMYCLFRKRAASPILVASTGLAAAGILAKADPVFMILYAGLSLVCWDLAALEKTRVGSKHKNGASLYVTIRIRTLLSVFSTASIVILLLSFIRLNIPFMLLFIFSIAAFYCIFRLLCIIRRKDL